MPRLQQAVRSVRDHRSHGRLPRVPRHEPRQAALAPRDGGRVIVGAQRRVRHAGRPDLWRRTVRVRALKMVSKPQAGPVREQPHRVLRQVRVSRQCLPRPAGRPRSRPPARGACTYETQHRAGCPAPSMHLLRRGDPQPEIADAEVARPAFDVRAVERLVEVHDAGGIGGPNSSWLNGLSRRIIKSDLL